jgi:hypothetical protein
MPKKTRTRKYKKHEKLKMVKHNYTMKQKKKIVEQLFSQTQETAYADFEKLKDVGCDKSKSFSKIGNDVVNFFTGEERLTTIGNKGQSFFDVWKNRAKIAKHYPYVEKVLSHYDKHYNTYPEIKVWKRIYDLYYGSVTVFRPLQAMEIYCRFQPTSVLDFTMGWGGRLVGACALGIPEYIGIDNNARLRAPYEKMVKFLKSSNAKTKIQLIFRDALTIDYSKFNYDMVLTSPPYYNIELYGGNETRLSKEEWNSQFYEPIFEKTYKYLQRGGHYCLNISTEIYEKVAKKVLGASKTKIPMKKFKRTTGNQNEEYIYVWVK